MSLIFGVFWSQNIGTPPCCKSLCFLYSQLMMITWSHDTCLTNIGDQQSDITRQNITTHDISGGHCSHYSHWCQVPLISGHNIPQIIVSFVSNTTQSHSFNTDLVRHISHSQYCCCLTTLHYQLTMQILKIVF